MGGAAGNSTSDNGRDRDQQRRVGLIAGWGRYPIVVAEALRRQHCHVYCLGILGHADPRLKRVCDDFRWNGLGKYGAALRYFKRHGVTDAVMAGKIHKTRIFQPWFIVRQLPDMKTIRAFIPHFLTKRKDCQDDTLMKRVISLFAADGIRFGPATDYAPDLLVRAGKLTRRVPSASQWKDIRFGWQIAKEMGRLDIGQSVAVKNQAVLAVEAIEGTDQAISRGCALVEEGAVVVKVSRPDQDMRWDVPTVGAKTVEQLIAGRGAVLAIEAEHTLVVNIPAVVEMANEAGLAVVAVDEQSLRDPASLT